MSTRTTGNENIVKLTQCVGMTIEHGVLPTLENGKLYIKGLSEDLLGQKLKISPIWVNTRYEVTEVLYFRSNQEVQSHVA